MATWSTLGTRRTRRGATPPHRSAASRAARWASLVALAAIGVASGADPATAAANAAPLAPAALAPAAIAQAACGTTVQAAVANGTLDIVGTDAADSIRLRFDAAGQTLDVYDPVTATTPGWRLAAAGFQTIHARLCDGDDRIVFDDSGGALSGRWAIRVEGEGGDDLVLGGIDVSAVSVDDAVQMIATLRTAKDMVDDALDLLDASTGPCAAAPCLVADTAGVLRAAGEDVVHPTAAYVRDIERDLVQPAAATVRDAHARIGVFAKTFVSQTATAAVAATDAITADAHAAAADFDLLLPTARGLLSDTTTLHGHAASLGLEVQSADPIGVFTRTIESQTTSIASLSRLCAEDPEPTETTSDEGQQDPSGLSPACAELERRIEALEAVTDNVGDDERPDSSATRLESEGNAVESRGDGLETSGEALGDDEVGTSRAAQLAAEGDALVAQGDGISADADAVGADWDAWVGQTEATLESAGGGMDARGQAEVQGAAETLRVRAGTDTAAAAERLRARAAQLQADLQQLMTNAAPLFGSGGVQQAGASTFSHVSTLATLSCSITPANTLSGGAGSDALIGTSGGDRIEGGDGDDLIVGADGADELLGEDGNDLVFGGDGGDELKGGDKVDLLVGNGANDCLYGGGGQTLTRGQLSVDLGDLFVGVGGDDLIVSGDGTSDARTEVDLAWGGDGADEMHLSHGGDLKVGDFTFRLGNVAFGQAGDDDIETADGVDVIFGGAGDDTVRTGKGASLDIKDSGGDSVLRLPLGDLVFGDDDDDTIDADDPAADRADDDIDVVFGGGGDDTIHGYGGGLLSIGDAADPAFELALGNVVFGGDGEDGITTADGVDVIFGGADGDTVQAGQGADLDIEGSDEDSTFRLALGDLILGDDGKDTLDGDDPAADRADDDIDVVFGGGGDDTIRGYGGGLLSIGDANDPKFELTLGNAVFGGDGDDDIACEDGIDVIFGGAGADTVRAGTGDMLEIDDDFSMQLGDVIFGQAGADTLHGDAPSAGAGADDDGIDVIFGGADDDKIYGDAGGTIEVPDQDFCLLWGNVLFGGPGDDLLRGDYETWDSADPHGGIDLIFGAAGADTIEGGGGSIVVIGDITTAQVVVIWFGNLLFGGPDDDTIRGANQADLSTCTNAKLDTFLNGLGVSDMGGAADLIVAGGGYDTVDAYDGIDFVFGNDGNDTLHADDGGLVIVPIDEIPTPIHFGNLMFGGEGEDTITSKGRLALLTIGQPEIDLLFGGPCDDDISAGDSVNLVFGNRAADTITAGDGVNVLFGNGDDDTVTAGDGLNLAFGNGGDDTIGTGDGVSLLFGNGDDDTVTAGKGLNVLFGNGSDDAVRGGDGVSILFGNAGDDVVEGGNGLTVAFGNRGVDDVRAGVGLAVLFGNKGDDDVRCGAGLCVAFGNRGNDLVAAGGGLNVLFGNADEDRVTTGAGLGVAFGNGGSDIVKAGGGGLFLAFGNADDDVIVGGPALNVGFGNGGADQYFASGGTNLVFGNRGGDRVRGAGGKDFLFGNADDDQIVGGGGGDFLFGNKGGDALGSNDGSDFLFGNRGNDLVYAADGGGCDFLFGNRGDDTIDRCQTCDKRFGGRGSDTKSASCTGVSPAAPSRGEVRGRVWLDVDGDTIGDVPRANVTVTAGSLSAVTDADGRYRIAGLAANTGYSVVEAVPAGTVQVSTPAAHAINVGAQGIDLFTGRDFVNRAFCAVSADGWGCVSAGCERGAAGPGTAATCRPAAVRRVMRCTSTGKVCSGNGDCPCADCQPSWGVVTCACLASDAGCTLVLDPKTGPRCGGVCAGTARPCQLIVTGDVYRCGCRAGGVIFLPIVDVPFIPGRATPTWTATARVTSPPPTTPRPVPSTVRPTETRRPTETQRPTSTPSPRASETQRPTATPTLRPTTTPIPLRGAGDAAAGQGAAPRARMATSGTADIVVTPNGAWTVLDELMSAGSFYAPLYVYTSTVPVLIDVTDLYVVSDRNEVWVDGQLIGSTPPVADWTALGGGPNDPPHTSDPAAAWQAGAFSKSTFVLPAGNGRVLTLRNTHIPAKPDGAPFPDGTVAFRLYAREGPTPTPSPTPTATPGCAPRPAGMVAWWALDEPGGLTARDAVGGHDGVLSGGAAVIDPAKVAAGRLFDGGLVRVADAQGLDGGEEGLSVDAWIRPAAIGGLQPIVTKRYAPADLPLGWSLHLVDGRLGFTWSNGAGIIDAVAPTPLAANEWHLVAASVRRGSPTGGRLTVDGALVAAFDTTPLVGAADTDAELHIAELPVLGRGQPARGFLGTIDEVELFDRPIPDEAFHAIFAADRLGKCDKPRAPAATNTMRVPAGTPLPPLPLGAAGAAGGDS